MKQLEMVFDVSYTGAVEGLHFDNFDLGFLGDKTVERASEIVFNKESQKWDVKLPNQDKAYEHCQGFSSYNEARSFEVEWLQECRKENGEPYSAMGELLSVMVRSKMGGKPYFTVNDIGWDWETGDSIPSVFK